MFLVSQEVPSTYIICLFKLSELHLSQKWDTKDISVKLSPCLSQSQTKKYPGRGHRIFFSFTKHTKCFMLRKAYHSAVVATGRISEWNNFKWVSAKKERKGREGIVSQITQLYCPLKRRVEEQLLTCHGAQVFDTAKLDFTSAGSFISLCLQYKNLYVSKSAALWTCHQCNACSTRALVHRSPSAWALWSLRWPNWKVWSSAHSTCSTANSKGPSSV